MSRADTTHSDAPAYRPVVVVTRDEREDDEFSRALAAHGLRPVPLPVIEIAAAADPAPLDAALAALDTFDWMLFTSIHAVDAVRARPAWTGAGARGARRPRVGAVGPTTARRLASLDIAADLVPDRGSAAELAEALRQYDRGLAGSRILWPRSEIAGRELPDALATAGAVVVAPVAYRTVARPPHDTAALCRDLDAGTIDVVAFLSPSSARAMAQGLPGSSLAPLGSRALVASIGPATSRALVELGATPDIETPERTAEALAAAIAHAVTARAGAPR